MLPSAPLTLTRRALKGAVILTTALALALPAAPALALGRNERNVLKGVAGALLLGAIIQDQQRKRHRPPQPGYPQPGYPQPGYPQPGYSQPVYPVQPVYPQPHQPHRPTRRHSIQSTAAAHAFAAYRAHDRQRMQQTLAAYGYYRGRIDGAFGPGTYHGLVAFANDRGESALLGSVSGVHQLMARLLY